MGKGTVVSVSALAFLSEVFADIGFVIVIWSLVDSFIWHGIFVHPHLGPAVCERTSVVQWALSLLDIVLAELGSVFSYLRVRF
jgi:hypothetical protein